MSNDDLSLSCNALKIIINLHSTLPMKNGDKWLNIDEMCKRLIHCGVVDSLLPEHVLKALKDSNRSGVLSCRMHHRIKYYRPSLFTGGAPQDLGGNINFCSSCPSKDFFLSAERNEDNGIERLNSELRNISKLQESIDGTSICCK